MKLGERNMIIRDLTQFSMQHLLFPLNLVRFTRVNILSVVKWVGCACCQGFSNVSRLAKISCTLGFGESKGSSDFALNGPCNAIYPEKMNSVSHKTWPFTNSKMEKRSWFKGHVIYFLQVFFLLIQVSEVNIPCTVALLNKLKKDWKYSRLHCQTFDPFWR